jgi:cytochrome b involved in lipid metabolism
MDCWSAINGSVYNLTSFVGNHPGGQAILKICGKDGSAIFNAQHGGGAKQQQILANLKVGVLAK